MAKWTTLLMSLVILTLLIIILQIKIVRYDFTKQINRFFSTQVHHRNKQERNAILFNPNICSGLQKSSTIIYIYNTMDNHRARNIIRTTYGSRAILETLNMRLVFAMGLKRNQTTVPPHIMSEFHTHQDIFVGNFIDSYRNLTIKGTSMLRFLEKYCQRVSWVIKLDDDIIANLAVIKQEITKWKPKLNGSYPPIFGHLLENTKPNYCPSVPKYCIQKSRNIARYADYVAGVGYVFSSELLPVMVDQINKTKHYMDLTDDVYMTGYLIRDIDKQFVNWGRNISIWAGREQDGYKMKKLRIYVSHLSSYKKIPKVWSELSRV